MSDKPVYPLVALPVEPLHANSIVPTVSKDTPVNHGATRMDMLASAAYAGMVAFTGGVIDTLSWAVGNGLPSFTNIAIWSALAIYTGLYALGTSVMQNVRLPEAENPIPTEERQALNRLYYQAQTTTEGATLWGGAIGVGYVVGQVASLITETVIGYVPYVTTPLSWIAFVTAGLVAGFKTMAGIYDNNLYPNPLGTYPTVGAKALVETVHDGVGDIAARYMFRPGR